MRTIFSILLLFSTLFSFSQQLVIDTVHYTGNPESKYNVAIMAESYTSNQMARFKSDAIKAKDIMFESGTYNGVKNHMNIFAIRTVSADSGVSKRALNPSPNDPIKTTVLKNTYFGIYFQNSYRAYFLDDSTILKAREVSSELLPFTDVVLILVNDHENSSGRASNNKGVAVATRWKGNNWEKYVINHEMGHAIAGLADAYSTWKEEGFNKSINNSPATVRWKNLLSSPQVGIHEVSANSGVYIPSNTCMMKVGSTHTYFCPVCSGRINNHLSTPRQNKLFSPNRIYYTNETNSSKTIKWDPIPGATHYDVSLGIKNFNTLIGTTTNTQITLNGAIDVGSANNIVQIRAYNNTHSSFFMEHRVGVRKHPNSSLTPPTNIQTSNITNTSFRLTWTKNPNSNATMIRLINNSGGFAEIYTSKSSFEFKNLRPGQKYFVQLATNSPKDEVIHYNSSFTNKQAVQLTSSVNYCASKGNNITYEWIQRFVLGSINNNSGANNGYGNFTSQQTNLQKGSNHAFTITPGFNGSAYSEGYSIWIDYNQDGDFNDSGEQVFQQAPTTNTSVTGTINIPSSALTGTTRLRVIMRYNAAPSACGNYSDGETEDYTVNITSGSAKKENATAIKPIASVVSEENKMIVYPNPSNGPFKIDYSLGNDKLNNRVEIRDIKGRLVWSSVIKDKQGSIVINSNLTSGVYIIHLLGANKTLLSSQRFICK